MYRTVVDVDGMMCGMCESHVNDAVRNSFKVKKALVVLDENNEKVVLSARNIPDVKTTQINTINTYDVMKYNTVIATKAAVEKIEEVYA